MTLSGIQEDHRNPQGRQADGGGLGDKDVRDSWRLAARIHTAEEPCEAFLPLSSTSSLAALTAQALSLCDGTYVTRTGDSAMLRAPALLLEMGSNPVSATY